MPNTPNYNLHLIDKKTEVISPDPINENMIKVDTQIKILEGQVNNIDVSGDVRQVINERVNADTSKPLSTLISGWVDAAKTAILDGISTLTNHVTSQHTATKSHVTTKVDALPQKSVWTDARGAKLDNLNQSLSATQSNIQTTVNSAMDNIKSHVSTAVVNAAEKVYVPSDTVRETILNTEISSFGEIRYLGKFIAKRTGTVKIKITMRNFQSITGYTGAFMYSKFSLGENPYIWKEPINYKYSTPIGAILDSVSGTIEAFRCEVASYTVYELELFVQKGSPIFFLMKYQRNDPAQGSWCKLIQACYDEV